LTIGEFLERVRRVGDAARSVREGLHLMPAGTHSDAEAWVARLEAEEKRLLEGRRQELMDDPNKQDVEHLLRTTSGTAP